MPGIEQLPLEGDPYQSCRLLLQSLEKAGLRNKMLDGCRQHGIDTMLEGIAEEFRERFLEPGAVERLKALTDAGRAPFGFLYLSLYREPSFRQWLAGQLGAV